MAPAKYQSNAFLYAYLVMASGCIYYLFGFIERELFDVIGAENTQKAGETVGYQTAWLTIYLVLLLKLAKMNRNIGPLALSSGAFLAFVVAALLSLIVNGADNTPLMKFGMYLLTIAFAAWLSISNSDSVDRVFDTLFRLGIVVLILHLLVYPLGSTIDWDVLGRPTLLGTTPYGGLFGHKNLAGNFFAISALVCFAKLLSPTCRNKPIHIFLIFLYTFMVVLAGAMGALLALISSAALTFGVYLVTERKGFLALVYWILVAGVALVVELVGVSSVFELIGRGADLTGRDTIWSAGMVFFWEQPWLGYGYANFFSSIERATQFWWMMPYHAQIWSIDSSYLDILLQLGAIGGISFAIILLKAIWTALRFAIANVSAYKIGPIALLSFVLIASISESQLLLHNYLFCVFVFWAYFGLQATKQSKLALARPWHRSLQRRQAKAAFGVPSSGG